METAVLGLSPFYDEPGRPGYPPQRLQRPEHLDPDLASKPWHDTCAFPWCKVLEQHFEQIRREVQATMADESAWPLVVGQVVLTEGVGAWRELVMLGPGSERGRSCCPITASLLDRVPAAKNLADCMGSCGNAIFARLAPGTHLKPHCGPTNARLTCHFGIDIPSGCGIRVGTETRCWEEGKCLVFDDSWEHEVWNNGDRDRVVLLVNFWHPDMSPEQWAETAKELRDGFYDV